MDLSQKVTPMKSRVKHRGFLSGPQGLEKRWKTFRAFPIQNR